MKKIIALLFLVISCKENTENFLQVEIDEDLKVIQLSNKTFLVEHKFPWSANSLVIITSENSALLIDTPYTPAATEKLVKLFKEELNIDNFSAINTHFHIDNCGGNSFLQKHDYSVYASDITKRLLQEKGQNSLNATINWLKGDENRRYRYEYEELELISANNIFIQPEIGGILELTFEHETVHIFYPGPGHTEDNLAVYLPSENILFGGCLIKSLEHLNLGNLSDGNIDHYQNSTENMYNQFQIHDDLLVIPGHGKPGGIELISHTLQLCD